MLEYPEIKHLANQLQDAIPGKTIDIVSFPGMVRNFVFSEETQPVFRERLHGKTFDHVESCGNHLYLFTKEGQVLAIGDTGGKLLLTPSNKPIPKKFDLRLTFTDGTTLTMSVQMWGFIRAYAAAADAIAHQEAVLQEARDPLDHKVTRRNFLKWLRAWEEAPKINAKKFIISRKYITGLGNGYTQDILWHARLHPRRKMDSLDDEEAMHLLDAIQLVTIQAVQANGRTTERDLYDQPGDYEVLMGRATLGTTCPACDDEIIKFSFEGGACYICPSCQPDPRITG